MEWPFKEKEEEFGVIKGPEVRVGIIRVGHTTVLTTIEEGVKSMTDTLILRV